MTKLYGALDRLTTATAARIERLYAAFHAGDIGADEFLARATVLVGASRARALALADVSLAAAVMAHERRPVSVLGLTLPDDDRERLHGGLSTLLQEHAEPALALVRFARSESAKAFQRGYVDAMRGRGITAYVRVLSPGACELCQWLAQDGAELPSETDFAEHTGCMCHPSPVFKDEGR